MICCNWLLVLHDNCYWLNRFFSIWNQRCCHLNVIAFVVFAPAKMNFLLLFFLIHLFNSFHSHILIALYLLHCDEIEIGHWIGILSMWFDVGTVFVVKFC